MQQLTHLMSAARADKKTVMGPLEFGLRRAHSRASLAKWTASDEQMCEFFPTEKCWQRARWQGWNEHSVCYVPGVYCAARTADPGLNIYSLSCVHRCMFVCVCVAGKASVDLRALQGCEARSSKRQKIPAAFGLVSASRKPGIVLHVHVHSPKVSPCRIILFISFHFSVQVWNITPPQLEATFQLFSAWFFYFYISDN